jgi:hypothetical protein
MQFLISRDNKVKYEVLPWKLKASALSSNAQKSLIF